MCILHAYLICFDHLLCCFSVDPTLPQFKEWLAALSASEYLSAFVEAGYDLTFIADEGLTEEDLDCCGIPKEKRGLRRKLVMLHRLDEFYSPEEDDDDEDDDDEEDEVGVTAVNVLFCVVLRVCSTATG